MRVEVTYRDDTSRTFDHIDGFGPQPGAVVLVNAEGKPVAIIPYANTKSLVFPENESGLVGARILPLTK